MDRRALGIPTEEEYISRYCQRRGIERIEHWTFYLAFSFFRLSAILQGIYKRALARMGIDLAECGGWRASAQA